MVNHFTQITTTYIKYYVLVCNIPHCKYINFFITIFWNVKIYKDFTLCKNIFLDNITQVKNKLNLCQETVAIVSEMEKQFYQDKVISLEDTPLTTKTTNKVSNKSLIQLESTLFHMASTPDLCEGVLYLFPVKVQDKFIIRYKTLLNVPSSLFI